MMLLVNILGLGLGLIFLIVWWFWFSGGKSE